MDRYRTERLGASLVDVLRHLRRCVLAGNDDAAGASRLSVCASHCAAWSRHYEEPPLPHGRSSPEDCIGLDDVTHSFVAGRRHGALLENVLHTYLFFFIGLGAWIADPTRAAITSIGAKEARAHRPSRTSEIRLA